MAFDATTNRMSGAPYAYDASGNMTNDGLNAMVYDAENRVTSSAGAAYSYDGNSLRVKKVSGATTTVYIFSATKVIAEYVNGAAVASPTREYIYSGSQLLATIESGTTKYQISDHLSSRLTTDSTGAIIGQQGHYPFGESWYASSTTTKWQFTSYERDAESCNDYAIFRYGVNRLGRFSSPDRLAGSIRDPQSLNRYAYVRSNPVNFVDPLGLLREEDTEGQPCDDGGGGPYLEFELCSEATGLNDEYLLFCTRFDPCLSQHERRDHGTREKRDRKAKKDQQDAIRRVLSNEKCLEFFASLIQNLFANANSASSTPPTLSVLQSQAAVTQPPNLINQLATQISGLTIDFVEYKC